MVNDLERVTGKGDQGAQIEQLLRKVANLERDVKTLKSQALGGKIQVRPDGTLIIGITPITFEENGLHLGDTTTGDGFFWDANSPIEAQIIGASATTTAELYLIAIKDANNKATLSVYADASDPFIGMEVIVGGVVKGAFMYSSGEFAVDDYISIDDGTTAPGATVGRAKIYVDTADGYLYVKFGDGFTARLARDS